MTTVAALDFGATSARAARIDLDADPVRPEIVHRTPHHPSVDSDGHLRWDWAHLVAALEQGIDACIERGPVASIGIDTWAVDYGLLDADGQLVADPYCYRDGRTANYGDVVDVIGARRLYALTGVQVQPFNTIFQLAAHRRDELDRARHVVLLPELLAHHLTGVVTAETTSAGSTGLVDRATGSWSAELIAAIAADPAWFPEIERPGTEVGRWRDIPVHLVGGHDTASAVFGMGVPATNGSAFVATGTWILVGAEAPEPVTTEAARRANVSNEAAVDGGVRLLKNVPGFWLVEQCRAAWGNPSVDELLVAAATVDAPRFDVHDPSLLAPDDMRSAICALAGLRADSTPAVVVRSIIESIAAGVADALDVVAAVGGGFDDVIVMGGAARSALLVELIGRASGYAVRVGPAEAAAIGNGLAQGVALGRYASFADARLHGGGA